MTNRRKEIDAAEDLLAAHYGLTVKALRRALRAAQEKAAVISETRRAAGAKGGRKPSITAAISDEEIELARAARFLVPIDDDGAPIGEPLSTAQATDRLASLVLAPDTEPKKRRKVKAAIRKRLT